MGSVRIDAIAGTPPPSQDDADIQLRASINDVLIAGSGGSDYPDKLIFRTRMRITDNDSGPIGETIATVQDFDFSVPVTCVTTPTSVMGSNCNVNTTADTLVPNFTHERGRAVVATSAIELLDLGPDGSSTPPSGACPPTCGSGDESVFVRQGVFTP
jgi:hypothetical protein